MYSIAVLYYVFVDLSVPSPPSDLAVNLQFIDYKPVVTITWNVSESACVWLLCLALLLTELEILYSHYLNGEKPPCYKLGNMYSIQLY